MLDSLRRMLERKPAKTTWTVGLLEVTLPAAWRQTARKSEKVSRSGPPGDAWEDFAAWQLGGDDGPKLFAFWWVPFPPRPGGPLVAAEEWPGTAAGRPVTIIRTSQFMGAPREVLVTHLRRDSPSAYGLVYAEKLDRAGFSAILEGLNY